MLRRKQPARRPTMMLLSKSALGACAAVFAMAFVGALTTRGATAFTAADELASHRAVYDLKLAHARGNPSAVSARGRILYDFSGSICDGYTLQFRQVSELDNGEGKVTLSDLRSTTWEDGAAKAYQFTSQNYLNQQLIDSVNGRAERRQNTIAVTLSKPKDKTLDLEATIIFPTEHVRKILEAAHD